MAPANRTAERTSDRYRRAHRPADRRILGGVAAGLADHLSVPVLWVRIGFVVATWFNGAGLIAYLMLWRFLPMAEPDRSPGLESAERRGLRIGGAHIGGREVVQTIAVAALGAGVLVLLQATGRGVSDSMLLPLLAGIVGIVVIWRQLDDSALSQWVRQSSGWGSSVRIAAGAGLVAVAAIYLVTQERGWGALMDLGAATVIALTGVGLILGPWIGSLLSDLTAERRERVRSQERADVAAHLHDSVLQTLALLQKNAADPALVATLARRQERDLRSWLYGHEEPTGDSVAASLRAGAADVEESHHVPIEVVTVGDAPVTADVGALVRAAREAMVNAAKHAGVDRIDVYAETNGRQLDVFVRDRGAGFDPDQIADDRLGVRESIVRRVERHGGTAVVKSVPGEGTEIHLSVPVGTAVSPVGAQEVDA
jgi:signal transduction histidine kinase/phage shock protein PspC (stress-responsive transcriptional regulator)